MSTAAAPKNHVWITATGEHIPVKDMKTSHIQNCINCLLGQGKLTIPAGYLGGKELWLDIFRSELQARLEQAAAGAGASSIISPPPAAAFVHRARLALERTSVPSREHEQATRKALHDAGWDYA
jgi:hypothetical protein